MLKNVYKHFENFSFNPAVPIESIKKMSTSNREVQGTTVQRAYRHDPPIHCDVVVLYLCWAWWW